MESYVQKRQYFLKGHVIKKYSNAVLLNRRESESVDRGKTEPKKYDSKNAGKLATMGEIYVNLYVMIHVMKPLKNLISVSTNQNP